MCDFISSVDFDEDFDGTNNWDNTKSFSHPGAVYAAASESKTHWFLYYAFYHPRDWVASGIGDGEHEHDMEGAMVFVRKNGTPAGVFEGLITFAHGRFFPYRSPEATYIGRGRGAIYADRGLRVIVTETLPGEGHGRPALRQEAQGHGVYGCAQRDAGKYDLRCPLNEDYGNQVRYVPSLTKAEIPATPVPSGTTVTASYKLIDITANGGLWHLRDCQSMFDNPSTFRGDESGGCGDGLPLCRQDAIPIWSNRNSEEGDDLDDSITVGSDPAVTVNHWFSFGNVEPVSGDYISHPFAHIYDSNIAGGQECAHDVCAPGVALSSSCSHCAAQICEVDPGCCGNSWEGRCVSQVRTVCQLRCERPTECSLRARGNLRSRQTNVYECPTVGPAIEPTLSDKLHICS